MPNWFKGLRTKLSAERHRRLLQNLAFLSVLQLTNYVLPFVTVPYLLRVGLYRVGVCADAPPRALPLRQPAAGWLARWWGWR
ncbi:MAG: hypothetical protein WBA12_03965 [Catalinimonas sp.]